LIRALLAGQLTWNIPLLFLFVSLTILYIFYLRRYGTTSRRRPLLYLTGIWLLYLVIGSPLLALSHLSFSFHMIQMSFVFFIIPPLILLGIPREIYENLIKRSFIIKIRLMSPTPITALVIFATLFFLYHLPFLLQIITEYPLVQKAYLILLFMLTVRMWWPIASPNPKQRVRASERKKYLLESSWYIMPACLMFIISALFDGMNNPFLSEAATTLCLPADTTIDILPPPFNTKYDQVIAGVSMLGLHKFSLFATNRLEDRMREF